MNGKHPTIYVRSSCFPQRFTSLIKMSKRWKKCPTLYVRFTLGKHQFTIIEVTRDISDSYVSTFFSFFKCFGSWKKEGISEIVC